MRLSLIDKQVDRALLAFMSQDNATEASPENWNARFGDLVAFDFTKNAEFRGVPESPITGGKAVFITVPTTHELMSTRNVVASELRLNPKDLVEAMQNRYGLTLGRDFRAVAQLTRKGPSETSNVPEIVLVLGEDAVRNLARQALTKLSKPKVAGELFDIDEREYRSAMQDRDSKLSRLVKAIVANGKFYRRDPELAAIKEAAGNASDFSLTVTSAEQALEGSPQTGAVDTVINRGRSSGAIPPLIP